jgi:hypothetical protein
MLDEFGGKKTARVTAALALALAVFWPEAARAFDPAPCPPDLPAGIECFRGRDANGAYLLAARPANAHGGLIVHTFGGPRLGPVNATTTDDDIKRFSEFLAEGWAWVSSSRRRGGFGVQMGVDDTEAARAAYVARFGRPNFTIAHGQSWGSAVTAALIERRNAPGADGRRPYDAAFLSAGVLAGGTRAYDMRVDLRLAFQAICGTHPAKDEPQYLVTLGLAPGATMARAELDRRVRECTGIGAPARTPEQMRAAADLVAASRIPEGAILGHMAWATNVFRNIADHVTGGTGAFGNANVRYTGTSDDIGLNARIARVTPDPAARAALAVDADLTGRVEIPVLTIHAIRDETAFVAHQNAYARTLANAGNAARLAQFFVDESAHSKMASPLYPAAIALLARWARGGAKPIAADFAAACEGLRAKFPGECRVVPNFVPPAWEARVNPR